MDESSSFGLRAFETQDTINQNHMEMCRFQDRDDDGYQKSLGALKQLISSSVRKKKTSLGEVVQGKNQEVPQGLSETYCVDLQASNGK